MYPGKSPILKPLPSFICSTTRASRLPVIKSCFSTPTEERSDPQRDSPLTPSAAQGPLISPALAPRGYQPSSASEHSEERSEFRAERPPKGQPAAIVHPPDLTHFLRHSRLAVFNPRPVHFPSFLYLQNIYIYFTHNIENRHHFCFLFLAHQSFSRCSEPFSRSPKFSQVVSQFLAYLCFRRWRACFSLTYAFAGGEPVFYAMDIPAG